MTKGNDYTPKAIRNGNDHAHDLFNLIKERKGHDIERIYACLDGIAGLVDRAAELMKVPETSAQATEAYHLWQSRFHANIAVLRQAKGDLRGVVESLDRAGSARDQYEISRIPVGNYEATSQPQ